MPQKDATLWLAEEWSRQFTRAMESMTGESVLITFAAHALTAEEIDPALGGLLWRDQPLSAGPDARIWVAANSKTWQEIGNRVLRSAGVDDATPEDVRGTYVEIVNQCLSGVASALSTRARKEISCVEGSEKPPSASQGGAAYSFEITLGDQPHSLLAVFTLSAGRTGRGRQRHPRLNLTPAIARGPSRAATAATASSIDRLLDVELPVSVSFGRAQLMLKDVIKLTTGSIVELNRALTEPVEVIVNNCVIARGEVVVIEGNYGIRIKQVISRQERLRTLY